MDTIKTTMSRGELHAIMCQAQREDRAHRAGFVTHACMEAAHRAERVARWRARREIRKAEMRRERGLE